MVTKKMALFLGFFCVGSSFSEAALRDYILGGSIITAACAAYGLSWYCTKPVYSEPSENKMNIATLCPTIKNEGDEVSSMHDLINNLHMKKIIPECSIVPLQKNGSNTSDYFSVHAGISVPSASGHVFVYVNGNRKCASTMEGAGILSVYARCKS
ncbi:MAG: hypothetical protein U1E02_15350, partial [Hydrogenophaga sp.]|nr:hypothetical protein [Hydrogenophaga sp.]